ncbi:ABC transporter permease [Streptomyces sp. 769]|uniref:ABC transporter permease n=1 Tax=Streptomyces sp. 769 TaxID=1262452 RepID=UPI00057CA9D6|nr:ABC transporter permease [Streptomyces sp. 769]AJC59446.1 ABC-2 type transporter [Streptomyces sp. 769]
MTQIRKGPTTEATALRQLVKTNARELLRDGKTVFFVLLFPLLFLAMFLGLGYLNTGGSYQVAVEASAEQTQVIDKLAKAQGFHAEAWKADAPPAAGNLGGYDAIIGTGHGRAEVTVDASKFGALKGLRVALADSGIDSSRIDFRTPDGGRPFDPVKASLPTALVMALMSVAFFGTATPLIALRQRGTLRLLGTTPLRRRTFVVAQVPVRLALVAIQLLVLGSVAVSLGFLPLADAARLFATGLLGALMLFSFGYLVAARLRNPEIANGALAVLMPVVLLLGGLFLPMQMMPGFMQTICKAMPTTYLVDALNHDLTGAASTYGLTVDWLVLVGAAVVFGGLATRLFRWDQGEER